MTDQALSAFELLRLTPTTDLWSIELNRILYGERDRVLESLGDAANYTEDVIAQSMDCPLSRRSLLEALEEFLFHLNPDNIVDWVVDLVRHYTPRTGYVRLLEMLRKTPARPAAAGATFGGQDIRLRALHALERYYPIAFHDDPLQQEPEPNAWQNQRGYHDYLDVLVEHLKYPHLAAYSARILVSLNAIAPTDTRLLQVFSVSPELLRIFLRSSLMCGFLPEKILSVGFTIVETVGGQARTIFSEVLADLGGTIRYYDTGAIAQLPHMEGDIFLSYTMSVVAGPNNMIENELDAYNLSDESIGQFLATTGD